MASLSAGRSYLTQQNCAIVDILCRLLKDCKKEDEAVRDHILVTMQKLSLRKIVREKLINSGTNLLFGRIHINEHFHFRIRRVFDTILRGKLQLVIELRFRVHDGIVHELVLKRQDHRHM